MKQAELRLKACGRGGEGASAAVVRNLIATAAGLKVSQLSEDNIRAAHCSSIAKFMEALEDGQVYALI